MSTRSMVVFMDSGYGSRGRTLSLYRHWDGYPAESGAAILEALKGAQDCEEAASRLLSNRYNATSYKGSEPVYRLADWTPEQQGDLEHVYIISRAATVWNVLHQERINSSYNEKSGEYRWSELNYGLAALAQLVNADRAAINANLAKLRASSKAYADCQDYPQVSA